jgi:hypothetical protein
MISDTCSRLNLEITAALGYNAIVGKLIAGELLRYLFSLPILCQSYAGWGYHSQSEGKLGRREVKDRCN